MPPARHRALSQGALPAPERRHRRLGGGRPRRAGRAGAGATRPRGRRPPPAANGAAGNGGHRRPPPAADPGRRFERKDTEQYHVCLGATGLSRHDDRRFALRVLDTIFGGTSSSRLFQEIRERRGPGVLGVLVHQRLPRHRPDRPVRGHPRRQPGPGAVGRRHRAAHASASEPATAEELSRAKENLKGRVVLALESTGARMNRLGSEILAGSPLMPHRRGGRAHRRGLAGGPGRRWPRSCGTPRACRPPGSDLSRSASTRRLAAVAPELAEIPVGRSR